MNTYYKYTLLCGFLCGAAITGTYYPVPALAQEQMQEPESDLMELLPEPELEQISPEEPLSDAVAPEREINAPPIPSETESTADNSIEDADSVFSEMAEALDEELAKEEIAQEDNTSPPLTPEEEALFFQAKDANQQLNDTEQKPVDTAFPEAIPKDEPDIQEIAEQPSVPQPVTVPPAAEPVQPAAEALQQQPAVTPPPAAPEPVTLDRESAKRLIRETMDSAYKKVAPINKDMAALYDVRYLLLTADTFNADEYLNVSEKLKTLHDSKHHIRNETVIFLADQLRTPELRRLLADYVDRRRGSDQPTKD